ncbi:MAG TPA: glycosyltransferase family 9 protein [Candidatus Binataceae bacterium]|nr:glycosyltransferase family 9 protein [Candidatus Binataceae bacterium]
MIYRLGSLGDFVVALPVLHLIARVFPDAERLMLTNKPVVGKAAPAQAVLHGAGLIHHYLSYPVGLRDVSALLKLFKELRAWSPQVLVYLMEPRKGSAVYRDALFFALCGIRRMVGVPLAFSAQSNLRKGDGLHEHAAERLARLVGKLGDARLDSAASWDLHLTSEEMAAARSALQFPGGSMFITACVGTKRPANDWGAGNWKAALARISMRYPKLGLALIGSSDERAQSDVAASGWLGPSVNLCGKLSPRESAAVIRGAIAHLGHDSGPMHLAAAAGVPCVAVFSARELPGAWFPWGKQHKVIYHSVPCAGCGLEICVANGKKCILSITPDEVYRAAVEILEPRLRGPAQAAI